MSKSASARRGLLRCRKGIAAVEFAVVGGLFLVVMLGAIDLGRYWMTVQGVRNFISDAERYGVVYMFGNGTTATCDQVITATGRGGAVAALLRTTSSPWCVRRRETSSGAFTTVHIDVDVDVTFNFVINIFGIGASRFRETTTVTYTY